ncbi:hypothetical protein RF11_07116 [Thelohanellus kitauei]|uniref:Uncharacterized protein n=1 Tax=Thelohanellus kitauei TaxID=669202 RepID=A0A0C2MB35_THEKT|nr:hypothetical protein RF11_07116 [Thelohanellus kitauei]
MSPRSSVLFYCFDDFSEIEAVLSILGQKDDSGSIIWKLDNKYFTKELEVITVKNSNELKDLMHSGNHFVEMMIIFIDGPNSIENFFNSKFLQQNDTQPMGIVDFNHCSSSETPCNEKYTTFCSEKQIEWINLYHTESSDLASRFKQFPGLAKLETAMNCHDWKNVELKDNQKQRENYEDLEDFMNILKEAREKCATMPKQERLEFAEEKCNKFLEFLLLDK